MTTLITNGATSTPPVPPGSLFTHYDVPEAHVRHVASLSLTLFDAVRQRCNLPKKARALLEAGALLHDVALETDPSQHHTLGRDIVLNTALPGLSEEERAVVACMVAFHRKKVRASTEPAFVRLDRKSQQLALSLAALLRVADGLDYSHTQTTHIVKCAFDKERVTLHLEGPHAEGDGSRALKKADLWHKVLPIQVTVTAAAEQQPAAGEPASPARSSRAHEFTSAAPALPENTLAEAGRRLLRSYFQSLLAEERTVRKDTDIEGVHEMRVATRRLRAAFPIIKEVAPDEQVQSFNKYIRKVARALGSVRDGDVFLDQVTRYLKTQTEEQQRGMQPLLLALRSDRQEAFIRLIALLDSQPYASFKRNFAAFVTDNANGWDTHLRVRDRVGSILWQRYEALRAYETHFDTHDMTATESEVLHDARIAGKQLRYLFDLFGAEFGPKTEALVAPLKELQDCLGALQDIVVAKDYVATLKVSSSERAALDAYVASREAEHSRLLAEFPRHWKALTAETYRRDLAGVLSSL